MRLLLLLVSCIFFISCGKKEWSKKSVAGDCMKDFSKKNEIEERFKADKLPALCDCIAGKIVAKYTSMNEADKDPEGARQIGRDCALEVLNEK